MKARKATEDRQKIKRDWRKKQAERVKQGKKPFFLKDCEPGCSNFPCWLSTPNTSSSCSGHQTYSAHGEIQRLGFKRLGQGVGEATQKECYERSSQNAVCKGVKAVCLLFSTKMICVSQRDLITVPCTRFKIQQNHSIDLKGLWPFFGALPGSNVKGCQARATVVSEERVPIVRSHAFVARENTPVGLTLTSLRSTN